MIDTQTLTLLQEIYFDIADLSYGESYKSLGYENKIDFYKQIKSKLETLEQTLTTEVLA